MTVLDAAPLCYPRDPKRDRLIGNLLIAGSVTFCLSFLLSLWFSKMMAPSPYISFLQNDWYYTCLIPALFPVTTFFAYCIWLSSQFFRYA